ncbi:MAG: undecaprenyl-diphosphate phosphatase [Erysipelotrichaceae bacterium]|nr:undecaprenyl-diphosphate phosphatase [Erysipelotrichaceae bacterium]
MIVKLLDIIKAILFGIVEGITEWLPVSSTGHMIILESIFDVKESYGEAFWNLFLVVIQLGAILAVIICFFNKLNPFFGKSLVDNNKKKDKNEKNQIWLLWCKVLIACLPSAIIGLLFDDLLDKYLYNSITVIITLILYGILFIIIEKRNEKTVFKTTNTYDLSFKNALFIGCFQLLALIPGTSRSGVTILGAMLLLCDRKVASEFSFYLSIPVMFGASLLKSIKYFISGNTLILNQYIFLAIGLIVAFAISLLVIKFLLSYIKKHDFKVFGYYRIILGIVLIFLFAFNVVKV